MNHLVFRAIISLLLCICTLPGQIAFAQAGDTPQQAYQILYQHNYVSEGKYVGPQCDTTELIITPTASRYGIWRRDELLAELKSEKAGILAAKPKSVVTIMSIEMLRPTLEQAGIDLQLKYLRPWFVPKEMGLTYKNISIDSLSFADELPKNGIITYTKPRPQFEWIESNKTEQILGYNCKKANTVIGGQTWTAWYSEDLPFDNGPAEFSGLPGLILRLSNNTGIEYRAIGFKQTQISPELLNLPLNAKALKESDYQDLRSSDKNDRRYYLLGADGIVYFIYMDTSEYATLIAAEK